MKTIDKKDIIIVVASVLLIIVMVFYRNYIDNQINIIDNPTFVGKVVEKKSIIRFTGLGLMGVKEYRLHITGKYIEDNEIIQIDKVFVVSADLYNQFDIGDTITHKPES